MEISWADVTSPLLELILERLPFADYLRFPAVCPSWWEVQHEHLLHHAGSPPYQRQMPWLMYSDQEEEQRQSRGFFYNPSEKSCYRIFFPVKDWEWYWKITYHGWFYSGLTVINLFTGSQIPIHYPRAHNMCPIISKAELMLSPTDPDCILLSNIIDNFGNNNACSKLSKSVYHFRDKTWTNSDFILGLAQEATVCGRKYYVLRGTGLTELEVLPIPVVRYLDMDMPEGQVSYNEIFLIECCGDILMTQMVRTFSDQCVYKFTVFKADLSRRMWVRLESLGDNTLFLSFTTRTRSFSLSAADTDGTPNRIYYVERKKRKMLIEYDYGSHQATRRRLPQLEEHAFNVEKTFLGWLMPSF